MRATGTPANEGRWLLAIAWAAAAALGWVYLRRGWIPHDVGTLGHAAERVLAGELPHRDFVDVYTGGQAMLNALAFGLLGTELMSLRLVFFGAYLLWVPVVWYVARSVASPALAAATTFLAAAITLPAYPEGMPSWYNLFFATGGAACLLRYARTGGTVWLVLAGAAGGVSILFKIVGLYFVAGALLFLLWLETRARPADSGGLSGTDVAYRVAAALGCTVVAFCALYVVTTGSGPRGLAHFALPPLAAVAAAAAGLTRESGRPSRVRFGALARTVGPLLLGVAVPVAMFLIPYAATRALGALYEGVFVLPRMRLDHPAQLELPLVGFVPAVALVSWAASRSRAAALAGGAIVLGLAATTHVDAIYRLVWWTLISLGPVLSVAAAWSLLRSGADDARSVAASLLLAVFAYANLVQVPYSAPIYFLYAAPLLLLLGVGLARDAAAERRLVFLTVVLAGFAVFRIDAGFIHHLGFRYRPHEETAELELPRVRGIRVAAQEKLEAEQLTAALSRIHAGPSILALPDAPEVYFLSGLANPSGTLFDFYEDPAARTGRVLDLLDREGLSAVVLNRRGLFAPLVEGPLLDSLQARLTWSAEIGRFRLLWKGPVEDASASR